MLGALGRTVAVVAAVLSLPAAELVAGDARWVEPVTGMEFVRIPGGELLMGSDTGGTTSSLPTGCVCGPSIWGSSR